VDKELFTVHAWAACMEKNPRTISVEDKKEEKQHIQGHAMVG
jgi:hypothetical protein